MLAFSNGFNSIRRRSCDLEVLQRDNAMQVERIRSKNEPSDQQPKRFSTLKLARKLSNRLSVLAVNETKSSLEDGENIEREQLIPKESIYNINVQLKPNRDQYIYRPGQCVQGTFTVNGQANKLASFKRITIRVHGMMIFSRYEKDETKGSGRSIGRKKWLFYDSKAMSYTKEELKNLGVSSTPIMGDPTQKHALEMPFAFELPIRCISYQHAFKFVREPAPLPPTMHFEVQEDEKHVPDDGAGLNSNHKPERKSSIKRTWNTLKSKISGNRTLEATVRYVLTVAVEWQENFLRYHITKPLLTILPNRCNLPFIVQPAPPTSTTFIHTITNSQSRQFLHLPAERTSTEFSGNVFHERGEDGLNDDIRDLIHMSGNRRPSITVNRQMPSRDPSTESVSTWVDLMLKDTDRGPQAWVFYHLYKRVATDQLVEIVFSHPATAAMIMDTQIPFNVSVSDPNYAIQPSSISFNLLRTIRSISPGGELKLEKRNALKRGEGDKSVVRLVQIKPVVRTGATPPPADEYSGQDYLANLARRNTFEGKLIIDSGCEANDELLVESKSVSITADKEQDPQEGKVHPCFMKTNKEQILIPSFNFRGLCIEYNLELNLNLVKRSGNQDGSLTHISFQTPMVKVASRDHRTPNPPTSGPQRRARSALGFSTVPTADAITAVDEQTRVPTRHSSLILESLITRQSQPQIQRPPEWNLNRVLPPTPSSQTTEPSPRQFPQRPPLRRTNQDDEITLELVRSSNESASTRRTSNGEQSAEYVEILSVPGQTAAGAPAASSSSSDTNSICLESGPETSLNDFASCLEPDSFSSINQEARQPMLQVPSVDASRSNTPLSREDLSDVIDNIEQVTSVEQTSYQHPAYLEGMTTQINPRMSLISMRTIDGPAPPYIGTLQDS
ncbi:uncharacterized protein FA14DRAFT_172525 [Meira miltonrushii]|uniref:Uncharacterized protein n=1 Tax=Meira miltonrushii TaxID=1280837 RepID=A0A316VE18_9BASI|nr:uncharacterized protein FA14DRAFT_172525 [Meira miltonrushii]PWN35927.1 hypothetical protein FA14DRAFT_172525 [Meira miltonrushii]